MPEDIGTPGRFEPKTDTFVDLEDPLGFLLLGSPPDHLLTPVVEKPRENLESGRGGHPLGFSSSGASENPLGSVPEVPKFWDSKTGTPLPRVLPRRTLGSSTGSGKSKKPFQRTMERLILKGFLTQDSVVPAWTATRGSKILEGTVKEVGEVIWSGEKSSWVIYATSKGQDGEAPPVLREYETPSEWARSARRVSQGYSGNEYVYLSLRGPGGELVEGKICEWLSGVASSGDSWPRVSSPVPMRSLESETPGPVGPPRVVVPVDIPQIVTPPSGTLESRLTVLEADIWSGTLALDLTQKSVTQVQKNVVRDVQALRDRVDKANEREISMESRMMGLEEEIRTLRDELVAIRTAAATDPLASLPTGTLLLGPQIGDTRGLKRRGLDGLTTGDEIVLAVEYSPNNKKARVDFAPFAFEDNAGFVQSFLRT